MTGPPPMMVVPLEEVRADLAAFDLAHPAPFVCRLRVSIPHLGEVVEHVSNTEFVRWIDRIAELHADAAGFTRRRMIDENVMWFVARHEIDYEAEAFGDDELLLATWVKSVERIKSWRETLIARPADRTIICRASTLWVFVDLATRRPKRIPPAVAAGFVPLETPV